jgi:hypothetical protein
MRQFVKPNEERAKAAKENMKAFHNDEKVKQKYLNRILAHQAADEIIKGKYWENGKGCAVGCTIHSNKHSAYETELGVPEWLAILEDRIFEGLPNNEAKVFPALFLESINIGADLNKIKIPMLIFIVESARASTKNKRALAAIDGVLVELRKDVLDLDALKKARDAADAAAASYSAARSAAAVAAAYSAASAARSAAAVAAYSAAYAARSAAAVYAAAPYAAYAADAAAAAAYSAAYSAAAAAAKKKYSKFANKLLELIRGCK